MWFPVSLWTVFTMSFLACSSLAYSSSHNSYPDYEMGHKGASRSWTALEGPYEKDRQGTKLIDLSSWPESDAVTLSRQMFGDKSADSAEPLMNRGYLDAEDFPKDKRESHSLSIVNPLDVLRQRLMLEMARRRMKENQDQIRENAVILKNLGKRSDNKGGLDARTKQDYLRRIHVSNSEDFEV